MAETLLTKEAVLEAHAANPAVAALSSLITEAKFDRNELTIYVAPETIPVACTAAQQASFTFLEDVTCVDWYPTEPRFQLVYHILSISLKQRLRLCARVVGPIGEQNPTIASITGIWPSANFYEREIFDLFGVNFEGHPRLTRIMMPIDWEGHPLRKDYPVEGYR